MEQLKETTTKQGVYFANLEAYNGGRMVGGWLYPLEYDSLDSFYNAIKRVTRNADEVAVHDYDDFPDMGEYPDHESLYNLSHALNESDLDKDIIIGYFNSYYTNDLEELKDNIKDIENSFVCTCNTFRDFADMVADEDISNIVNEEAQQFVFDNFDYEGYAHDLRYSYNVIELDNYQVAIFDHN